MKPLSSKKKTSHSITNGKPPKAKRRGFTSVRNKDSQNIPTKSKIITRKTFQVLKNPEIVRLAPFSTSLVTGTRIRGVSQCPLTAQIYSGARGNPSCLKNNVEKKTILKEIQNLSEALLNQHNQFELAVERIKEERKKHKKTKRHLEKSELKKDHITYLKRRIEDLKRNEENLLQDL